VRVLDLATGTGANLRYLAPRLGPVQTWVGVDHDPRLLAILAERMGAWARRQGYGWTGANGRFTLHAPTFRCSVRVLALDLATGLDGLPIEQTDLVTASALLDLVSQAWLARLLGHVRAAGSAVMFALTYDGSVTWQPPEPEDPLVNALVNRHQGTDKGFGPALGPRAHEAAATALRTLGYRLHDAPSPWHVGPQHRDLQAELHAGWHDAALALAAQDGSRLDDWLARRLGHVGAGRSGLHVGHRDLLGWPS
jgi:SAM-dependent methyltransferase